MTLVISTLVFRLSNGLNISGKIENLKKYYVKSQKDKNKNLSSEFIST